MKKLAALNGQFSSSTLNICLPQASSFSSSPLDVSCRRTVIKLLIPGAAFGRELQLVRNGVQNLYSLPLVKKKKKKKRELHRGELPRSDMIGGRCCSCQTHDACISRLHSSGVAKVERKFALRLTRQENCTPRAADDVAIKESKPDGSGLASMRNSNEASLRRPATDELERLRADAPPHMFEMAEKLIDNSSGYKMRVDSRKSQEMAWMKLLSSVQQLNVAKGVRPKLILQLLDLMYANGAQVNAFHICRAISVCVNEKAMSVAEEIIQRTKTMGNRAAINNAFVFAKLIQGYCSSNQRKEAFAMLAAMDAEGVIPDVVIYNTLLETEQSPEGVDFLLKEMKARAIQLNERTYSAAIRCYGRTGQLGAVRRLWQQLTKAEVSPSVFTFNSLLDAYASVGDVDSCKEIMTQMKLKGMPVTRDSYNTLLKAHACSRDADGAVGLLRTMQRQGVKPCIITYNTVMDACVRGRAMQRALSLAMELRLHHLKPDSTTFATMLRSAGLLRDADLVHKVLQDMETSQCPQDEITYRCAVYAFVHCGEGGSALEILERMNAAGLPPAMTVPELLIKSVDAALLRECTAAAPTGRLQQFLADMAAAGLTPNRETGRAIVRKLAHSHGVHMALDVAGEFLRVGITSLGLHTWQSVIGASVAHAEQNPLLAAAEVSRILSSMEAEGTSPDRMIYEAAISIYVRCGDGDQAIKLYERMQKANLAMKLEGGKDPIERMLLDVMDAALVGALASGLGTSKEQGGLLGSSEPCSEQAPLTQTASIVQDLAKAGIRVKPGAVTSIIRQLCVDVSPQDHKSEVKVSLAIRKPMVGSQPPKEIEASAAQDRRVQRLERAMGLVEASDHLFGMQVTSFVYGALMEACIRLQQVEQVEFLWQQMRSRGVTPDVGTWVLRIQALTTVGSIGVRTHNLLAEAANDQLELDPHLLRALLKGCYHVKDMGSVAHLRRMLDTSARVQPSL
ncbi:hypothetical protein CY35_04G124300 [Sphagnum magellanicum]|nr:hypothetical protein CY35_04G124300 [Sphagnum magellanicum]